MPLVTNCFLSTNTLYVKRFVTSLLAVRWLFRYVIENLEHTSIRLIFEVEWAYVSERVTLKRLSHELPQSKSNFLSIAFCTSLKMSVLNQAKHIQEPSNVNSNWRNLYKCGNWNSKMQDVLVKSAMRDQDRTAVPVWPYRHGLKSFSESLWGIRVMRSDESIPGKDTQFPILEFPTKIRL